MDKVVWITGASSGIGEALAKEYSTPETVIILSGRNAELLQAVAEKLENAKTQILPLDVTDHEAIEKAVSEVKNKYGRVDVLINNAGLSQRSLATETKMATGRSIMEVNFFGAVKLTQEVLPMMIENKIGNIGVISSISGKFGFPQRSFYAASKHALHGYFESLSLELHGSNVHITMAAPGRINTNISVNALKGDGSHHNQVDRAQSVGMSAEECAKQIKSAIAKNKHEVYIGGKETLMVYFKRYVPWLFRRIARKIDPNG